MRRNTREGKEKEKEVRTPVCDFIGITLEVATAESVHGKDPLDVESEASLVRG